MSGRDRVLLKVSGEALASEGSTGFSEAALVGLVREIAAVHAAGIELGVVVGGGNLMRGAQLAGTPIRRDSADRIGMLATVMNAVALRDMLAAADVPAEILCGLPVPDIGPTFTARRAEEAFGRGAVGLYAGGTGHPYFTTDTAAALRAVEIRASRLLKATKVDGVYDSDPNTNPDAKRFDTIGHGECLARSLNVMDQTAFALCRDNALPIVVFDMRAPGSVLAAARGDAVGTTVVPE